jgi:CubicO group peptidase (beta-lactamase class C family)
MAAEEGRLRLNDPVSMYIPEFRKLRVAVARAAGAGGPPVPGAKPAVDFVAPNRELTIQDLLTHTAGLMSGGLGQQSVEVPRRPDETLAQYVPRLGDAALDFQPGSKWSYSPTAGIEVLSRIVEIVSGQSFDVYMRERIFKPLGMNSTGFVLSPEQRMRLPPLYRKSADGKWEIAPEPAQFISNVYFSGAAGLMGTVQDYLAFEQMRLNGGELNGKRLLSPKSTQLMAMNHVGDLYRGIRGDEPGAAFGLAVAVTGEETHAIFRRSTGSSGWTGAFGTMGWIDPREDLAAVMFIQQSSRQIQVDFGVAVMQAIVKSDVPRQEVTR